MSEAPGDEELMLRYRNGDAAAFDELYRRHRGPLFRYLLRQTGVRASADELFQDIWMKLIAARARYQASATFRTYLYHLAHNRLVDHYRRYQRDGAVRDPRDLPDTPIAPGQQPEQRAHAERQVARLLAILSKLPGPQREAFLLREEGGLSVAEIAEVTGVGLEAAKSRLRYATGRLREGLEEGHE